MWKERYRKANEEIPLNKELLGALLETAEKTHNDKRHYVFRFGTVAAAAMIGIGIFSYSYFREEGETLSDPIAQVTQPKAKLVQEIAAEPSSSVVPETEPQKEEVKPQPVIIVATEESVVENPEPSDEKNEDLANLPATASALMPRTIPSGEQPEETELPISEEISESDVADETTPPVDEENSTEIETEDDEESEQLDQESPTPTPTPEIELSESES